MYLETYDPQRASNWRALRVQEIFREGPERLPSRVMDDREVWRLFRYLTHWRMARNPSEERRVKFSDPEIYYCQQIVDNQGFAGRDVVEARILAGQTDQEIAEVVGTAPEAVDLYEKLHFNVRDRLKTARSWILQKILGTEAQLQPGQYRFTTPHKMSAVYKLVGFFGGPVAIEFMEAGFHAQAQFPSQGTVGSWWSKNIVGGFERQAMIVSHTYDPNQFDVFDLVNSLIRIWELRQRYELADNKGEDQHESMLDLVKGVFDKLKLMMGDDFDPTQLPDYIREYRTSAVEARPRDWLKVTSGQDTDLPRLTEMQPLDLLDQSSSGKEAATDDVSQPPA